MSRPKALPNRLLRQNQEGRLLVSCGQLSSAPLPLKKLGWLQIASSQPGAAIPVKLAAIIIRVTIMVTIITMPAIPRAVIRTIIRSRVIPVRIIGTVRVISVIARPESDTEVNLSIRTRGPRKRQTPGHDSNQQKFLHDSPPDNLTGGSVESFPVIRSQERLDIR